jgi:hypothetical protein
MVINALKSHPNGRGNDASLIMDQYVNVPRQDKGTRSDQTDSWLRLMTSVPNRSIFIICARNQEL